MHYHEYLGLDTLLGLQHPRSLQRSGRIHAAEHFFIIVHQTCELYLAQILLDLAEATAAVAPSPSQPDLALEHLHRVRGALGVLGNQVAALDHLSPYCFAAFRPYLGTASALQSEQCQQLDRALGVHTGQPAPILAALTEALAVQGDDLFTMAQADLDAGTVGQIMNVLLEIAQEYWRWKVAHLSLAMRLLGDREGTGGSSGAAYLARRLVMPFAQLREALQQAHVTRSDQERWPRHPHPDEMLRTTLAPEGANTARPGNRT